MLKRAVALAVVGLTLAAAPALAQEKRVEVSALFGWTFSDGVDGEPKLAGNGQIYDRIDPNDSFKFRLDVGVMANENVEFDAIHGAGRVTSDHVTISSPSRASARAGQTPKQESPDEFQGSRAYWCW